MLPISVTQDLSQWGLGRQEGIGVKVGAGRGRCRTERGVGRVGSPETSSSLWLCTLPTTGDIQWMASSVYQLPFSALESTSHNCHRHVTYITVVLREMLDAPGEGSDPSEKSVCSGVSAKGDHMRTSSPRASCLTW